MNSIYERRRSDLGFTIIELMLVVTLIGVLVALAAPALSTFISRSTMRGLSADFSLGLQRARIEAVNRNACATICMSSTAGTSSPQCAETGEEWGIGWIAFLNPTCDTSITESNPDAAKGESVVHVRDTSGARYSIRNTPTGLQAITFNSRGNPIGLSATAGFALTDTSASTPDAKFNRKICLDKVGRVLTLNSSSACP